MTTWLTLTVVAIAIAWVLGVRRGKRLREPDVELAYALGIEEGRRRDPPRRPSKEDHRLAAAAAVEVAEMNGGRFGWVDDDRG